MNFPSWHAPAKIYTLGHRAIKDLLLGPVNIEEKVDGSYFQFGLDLDGELHVRSKGAEMLVDAPEKMFSFAVDYCQEHKNKFIPGYTYKGEYLRSPKHNALCYSRIPNRNIIIFDINTGEEEYLDYYKKAELASQIDLEVVPRLFTGQITSLDIIRDIIDTTTSILGGQKIEGVVIKPQEYNLFGEDKKCLMGKFVSESFKEVHRKEWKEGNPNNKDIIVLMGEEYRSQARWNKSIIHAKELGKLTDSPKDIGYLIKAVQSDIIEECKEEIMEKLFKHAWPHISRKAIAGLPEWYKEELLKQQAISEGTI